MWVKAYWIFDFEMERGRRDELCSLITLDQNSTKTHYWRQKPSFALFYFGKKLLKQPSVSHEAFLKHFSDALPKFVLWDPIGGSSAHDRPEKPFFFHFPEERMLI